MAENQILTLLFIGQMFGSKCFVQRLDARVVDVRVEKESSEKFWGE